jgi:hypothetical protein
MGQRVQIRLREREFSPEQLSAFLLQKIMRDAFLGEPVARRWLLSLAISMTTSGARRRTPRALPVSTSSGW